MIDFIKTSIMFIFKIKQQLMRIVLSVKIVERNFKIMFDILNVFYKNVKKSNNSVNKQKFFMMRNIKMQILLLKFVFYIKKNKSSLIMNFQAYKNFGDKVATLKKKLDSLIRDLPETVSSPSADNVPSPGKHNIQGFHVVRLHMNRVNS